eukprot:CAMPEP_0197024568 /NCGR_PEP_ID=MMETSP1384-20130603/5082_1 /TAXON_ID=29189 /ORGANISM="Ammonia sp." /LENGTH=683 /DNA_ID=CAMNT_0042452971 /DNA_START=29 /DNA_END=2080 /DNA_ORIENTATION=+
MQSWCNSAWCLAIYVCFFSLVAAVPNFVFIIADDLGWNDIGYHAATNAYTPVLDALRADGLEFDRFYVYPKCAPTRTSFFTGSRAHNLGMQNGVGLTGSMPCSLDLGPGSSTSTRSFWTHRLKACNNYQNYLIGKWHCGFFEWADTPLFRGFDSFLGFYHGTLNYTAFTYDGIVDFTEGNTLITTPSSYGTYATNVWADEAVEIIKDIAISGNAGNEQPFTLTVAFNAPHSPIEAIQPYKNQVKALSTHTFKGDDVTRIDYVSMVRAMDKQIEKIVETLKGQRINNVPMWKNTWVWFFSDNGAVNEYGSSYPLRGAKETLFEGGVRAPAFVTGGPLPDDLVGERTDQLVHISDIAKTVCTQSGSDCSDVEMDGVDLTSLIENTAATNTELEDRYIVLNANNYECEATYNGQTVCGGILKDYGSDGIFKAVIGNQIVGKKETTYGWTALNSQQYHSDPTVDCGGDAPSFTTTFLDTDCANNNQVCLFNLTGDPCEHEDLSTDAAFEDILGDLMAELQAQYDSQLEPFFASCVGSGQQRATAVENGGWTPWAEDYYDPGDDYTLANTVELTDTCPASYPAEAEWGERDDFAKGADDNEPAQQQPDEEPNPLVVLSLQSPSWVMSVVGLLSVLLVLNMACMCHLWWCKKARGGAVSFGKAKRSGYGPVKVNDSEMDDSEVAVNVVE